MNSMEGASIFVVGGGPAGLAAAIMLAKHHFNNITILEVLSEEEYFDTSRSYPYGVSLRGQICLQKLDVLERVKEVGVDSSMVQGATVSPNGNIKTMPTMARFRPKGQTSYITYRQEISKILFDKIENDYKNSITFHFNVKIIEFKQLEKNQELQLTYQIKNEDPIQISPYLVIGADGQNSFVRKSLHEITNKEKFELIQKPVIGSGAIAKIIKVPLNFYLDKNKQKFAENETVYRIVGVSQDEKTRVGFASFCPSQILTLNHSRNFLLTFHNSEHKLLKIQNREEFFKYLENQIPQLPIRDIITPEEADNFIQKGGIKFPLGGYTRDLSFIIQEEKNNDQNTQKNIKQGVILIGDVIHHFPPYLGLGVNAALEDVSVLYDLFQKYDNKNLLSIMHEYENIRKIDSKALLQLAQYSIMRPPTNWINDTMYKYDRIVKTFLHKKVPRIFPPAPANLVHRNELRFSEIMRLINSSNYWYRIYMFMLLNTGLVGVAYLYRQFKK